MRISSVFAALFVLARNVLSLLSRKGEHMSDNLTWRPMLANLVEASAEISQLAERLHYLTFGDVPKGAVHDAETHAYIERKRPLSEGSLFVMLEHSLHHLNWAWNCRHEKEACVWKFCDSNAERWGKLPRDLPFDDLWPRDALSLESPLDDALDIAGIRMFLLTADIKLQSLAYRVSRQIDKVDGCRILKFKGFSPKAVDMPLTEEVYGRRLHVIYGNINGAWNNRHGTLKDITPETIGEYMKFSADFAHGTYNMWP